MFQDPNQDILLSLVCHVSLGLTCLWQFLRLPFFWWPRQFWVLVKYIVECFLIGICPSTPPPRPITLRLCFLGKEDHRDKVSFSSHNKGTCYQHDSSLLMLTPWSPGWRVFVIFFLCKVIFFPFLYCSFCREVSMRSLHLRSRELCSFFLRTKYLHKLLVGVLNRDLPFLLPNEFNHLFI